METTEVDTVNGRAVATFDAPDVSVVTEALEDGLRSLVVLSGPDAPTRYDFDLGLPEGISARLLEDGSVAFEHLGEENVSLTVGGIDAPWSKDANGADVPTHFELDGNVLTQVVEHQRFAYPITADPKLTYGTGVYLNLWGWEANATRYIAGGAIAALGLYGCNFSKLPTGVPGAVIKLVCSIGGGAAASISFLKSLMSGSGNYPQNGCYQTRLAPNNGRFDPVGTNNCS